MAERQPPVFSPVDYDAWSRGYTPPSEHVLIDALQFRRAKVQMSTSVGRGGQVWVVYSGPAFNSKARRHLLAMMEAMDAALIEDERPASGSEAAEADETRSGSAGGESPVAESETPNHPPRRWGRHAPRRQ
ncbi:hypothetical protein HNR00_003608 [Methylorubrum rhodinum]|uniref:Uncharacterized protein n=1 Tax=Methylorubrum rhodinum TaxID=29428 RepID=A0A840ZPS6_9HYPH|nr:hypothetical protein [Methylorubrum rhodinum]MBB5758881.1 hypothetical protein [Methylorubrum rhodinum]